MRVTFVTSNPHKFWEIRAILRPFGIDVAWRRQSLPEPQAQGLRDVVRMKLEHVPPQAGPVLVEDSGVFLRGLNGFPGVYSRYVYDTIGLDGVLRLLSGRSRAATFRTVAGLRIGRTVSFSEGRSPGSVARAPRGAHGFGYDPIFIPMGSRRTYAEMATEEKNRTSHRALAMRALARTLNSRRGRTGRRSKSARPSARR